MATFHLYLFVAWVSPEGICFCQLSRGWPAWNHNKSHPTYKAFCGHMSRVNSKHTATREQCRVTNSPELFHALPLVPRSRGTYFLTSPFNARVSLIHPEAEGAPLWGLSCMWVPHVRFSTWSRCEVSSTAPCFLPWSNRSQSLNGLAETLRVKIGLNFLSFQNSSFLFGRLGVFLL